MTRNTKLFSAAFLGLATLFTASTAMAGDNDKPLRGNPGNNYHRDRDNDYRDNDKRINFGYRSNDGSFGIQIGNGGHHHHVVTERVWVPGRYEERHVQILVEAGHWHTTVIPAVYKTVRERHGYHYHERQVLVCPERIERIWHPDRYETRCEKVWVPGYYKDVQRVIYHENRPNFQIRVSGRDW